MDWNARSHLTGGRHCSAEDAGERRPLPATEHNHLSRFHRHPGHAGAARTHAAGTDPCSRSCSAAERASRGERSAPGHPEAALAHLEKARSKHPDDSAEVYDDLAQHYQHRLATLSEEADGVEGNANPAFYKRFIDLSRELLRVERHTAVQLRNQRRISD